MVLRPHIFLLVCVYFIGLSDKSSGARTLFIGRDCGIANYEIYHVNKEETYTIEWNGETIPSYCTISFIGRDDGYMNEYKVCVTKEKWSLPNCGAKVSLEKGIISSLSEMYTCYYEPSHWCGNSDEYVDVVFASTSTFESGSGQVRLKVTAVMTYNYNLTIGIAIGGSIGGLFFLILVIVLISRAKARQRATVILTSGYTGNQPAQGLRNPIMYSIASGSYPDNNFNKPPPSYESVVNNASPAYTQVTTPAPTN